MREVVLPDMPIEERVITMLRAVRRRRVSLASLVAFAVFAIAGSRADLRTILRPPDRAPRASAVTAAPVAPDGTVRIVRAVDGDTAMLEGGETVRYLGIDTPETMDPRKPVQCFGPEASTSNHTLVDGQRVRLVRDVEDRDQYGRLLRYVYLTDGTFVNLELVRRGFAPAYTYPPNVAHVEEFRAAARAARLAERGLWSRCRGVRADRGEAAYQRLMRQRAGTS